jgi:hypothetical protein
MTKDFRDRNLIINDNLQEYDGTTRSRTHRTYGG